MPFKTGTILRILPLLALAFVALSIARPKRQRGRRAGHRHRPERRSHP